MLGLGLGSCSTVEEVQRASVYVGMFITVHELIEALK